MGSVSVVITTYNRPSHLCEALSSVGRQTRAPAEILVIDDGSDADVRGLIKGIGFVVRYHRMPRRSGANACRNLGLALARGDWVALLDDDDVWMPQYLEIKSAHISSADVCLCGYAYLNRKDKSVINRARHVTEDILRAGNPFCGASGFFLRTEVGREIGFDEGLDRAQDWDFLVRAVQAGYRVENLSLPLFYYRLNAAGGITSRYQALGQDGFDHAFAALHKHREWLGEQPYQILIARRMLSFLRVRRGKLGWMLYTASKVGISAAVTGLYLNVRAWLARR